MMPRVITHPTPRPSHRRHRVLAAFGVAAVLAATACSGDAGGAAGGANAGPQSTAIAIRGFQFVPAVDTVQAGDTVVWTNEDMVPHTATSLVDGVFDSGSLDEHGVWRWIAATSGTHEYECTFHPNMRGTLVVR